MHKRRVGERERESVTGEWVLFLFSSSSSSSMRNRREWHYRMKYLWSFERCRQQQQRLQRQQSRRWYTHIHWNLFICLFVCLFSVVCSSLFISHLRLDLDSSSFTLHTSLFLCVCAQWISIGLIDTHCMCVRSCVPAGMCEWASTCIYACCYFHGVIERLLLLHGFMHTQNQMKCNFPTVKTNNKHQPIMHHSHTQTSTEISTMCLYCTYTHATHEIVTQTVCAHSALWCVWTWIGSSPVIVLVVSVFIFHIGHWVELQVRNDSTKTTISSK